MLCKKIENRDRNNSFVSTNFFSFFFLFHPIIKCTASITIALAIFGHQMLAMFIQFVEGGASHEAIYFVVETDFEFDL